MQTLLEDEERDLADLVENEPAAESEPDFGDVELPSSAAGSTSS